jgi:hypothetical protein
LTISCEDIFEEDITKEVIQIISPTNGQKIESNAVNFQWTKIDGASNYRLQIYDQNQTILLDSLTAKENLKYPLNEGNYNCKVRAENFAYISPFSPAVSFSTFVSNNLTKQQVVLSSPQNEVYLNFKDITLNWFSIPYATSYFVIVTDIISGQQIFANTAPITNTFVNLKIPNLVDAKYEWRVKAKNDISETEQYSSRIIYIDTVNPNQVLNQTPTNNSIQTINQELNFSWTAAMNSGSLEAPISYKIEFSNEENFTTINQTFNQNATTLKKSFSSAGIYFWRVKALDQAGNISVASSPFKFTIN